MAASATDPDLAPFVGAVHLGQSILAVRRDAQPQLAYLTAMEREEAARTGLSLLSPERLELEQVRAQCSDAGGFWPEVLGRVLRTAGLETGRLGLAGRFPAGAVHYACSELTGGSRSFVPAHELLRELRQQKTRDESTEIRRVSAALVEAFSSVASLLAAAEEKGGRLTLEGAPLTVGHLRGEIQRVFASAGLEQPEGNIVAMGADAGVPHSQGASTRVVEPHAALVVDLFPKGRLFGDCTRTFCVGEPPADLARAHKAVHRALVEAEDGARPGTRGFDLQSRTCDLLEAEGYATARSHPGTTRGYVHGLGHGVGLELHELPSFRSRPGRTGQLHEGDVFTLEPGLYDPDAGWGVRLEDLCTLGSSGLEVLTPLPYELDPSAWPT